MTDKQPEALRLAEHDERLSRIMRMEPTYAPELRRLHEVETKYHESVGGFKRDLVEKLEQQRKKSKRLTDELCRLEKHYVVRNAELRRLHEVNAELVEALKLAREQAVGWYDDSRGFDAKRPPAWLKPIDDAIAKATGEQQ